MNQKLKVEYVSVSCIIPSPNNPRYWSEKARSDLKESIKRHGLTEPLLVNSSPKRKGCLISGHFRLEMAKELEYETVPVIYLNIPSEEKERELLLRMNANQGAWDFDLLKSFDINMLLDVGFENEDLSHIWDENLSIEDDELDVEEEIEKAKKTSIKSGDLFQLGHHRLLCGDSTESKNIEKLLGKEKVDLINIDFPYNIGVDYSAGLGGRQNYGGKTNDKKSEAEYEHFVKSILLNALSVSKDNCHVFTWLDEKYVGNFQTIFKESGVNFKRLCMWIKGSHNPTPQVAFNRTVELCMYGTKGKPFLSENVKNLNEVMNREIGSGNRLIDDVLDMLQIWLVKRLPGNQYEHPTMKPPSLYEKSFRRCSKVGDVILDLCAGSGSLMVACEGLKRQAFLAEVEPVFTQVIINRYEKISGNKAKKLN
ncbi:MAG: DNA methyltransferase [Candidatus Paceibacterota bacterium]|jgi:DNA modification methylase